MDARALSRWEAKVKRTSGCWLWLGAPDKNGYGWFRDGSVKRAHRAGYEHFVGPIPSGMALHHRCETPACVNPSHLQVVTWRENILLGRGITAANASKTHCIHGHEFTPENTYIAKQGRQCRMCHRDASRRHRAAPT